MLFSVGHKNTYFDIPIVFYSLFGSVNLISGRFYHLHWPQPLWFSLHLLKPFFLCQCKGVFIPMYLDDILVLIHSKYANRRVQSYFAPSFVFWITHLFLQVRTYLTHHFCFLGLCWDTVDMSVSLSSGEHLEIKQFTTSLLQTQSIRSCPFWARPIFVSSHAQFCHVCYVIQSDMLDVYHSPAHLFCFHLSFQLGINSRVCLGYYNSLMISPSWCGYYYRHYTQSFSLLFLGFWAAFIL